MTSISSTASALNPLESTPTDLAKSYRGRRISLYKEYKNTEEGDRKNFLKSALIKHTKLMIQDNRPVTSYLWKAEKNGHTVILFGESHLIFQKADDLEGFDPHKDDLSPVFKTYIHPKVLDEFENSDQCYVELHYFNHMTEITMLNSQLSDEYETEDLIIDSMDDLSLEVFVKKQASLSMGLIERMLMTKTGTLISCEEIGAKLEPFITEMENISIQKESLEISYKTISQNGRSIELTLESLDAVQMGDLDSLALIYQETHPELKSSFENRNINLTNFILDSLEKGEKAFFAPGAMHYLGEKGILRLLENQGVTITRVLLT